MRRLLSVSFLFVFLASCGGVSIPEDYVSFVSSDGQMEMYHPAEWSYGQNEVDLEAVFLQGENPVFIFPHPVKEDLIFVDPLNSSLLSEEDILGFMEDFKASTSDYSYTEITSDQTVYGDSIYFMEGKSTVDDKAVFVAYLTSDLGSVQLMYGGLYTTLEDSRNDLKLAFRSFQFLQNL